MRKLIAISALGTVLGYAAVHVAFFSKSAPAPLPETPAAVDAEPVVLAQVIDVTDTDALLDARPGRADGVPFDAEPIAFVAPAAATPIPHAAD